MNTARALLAPLTLLLPAAPAAAMDVFAVDWWSNRTGSMNVEQVTLDGQGEMLRLGAATSGFLEGSFTLPGTPLAIWELVHGVRTSPLGALPGESVKLFIGGSLIWDSTPGAPGASAFDTLTLWGLTGAGAVIDYRFEFQSPTPDPARHLVVLDGKTLHRDFDVQLGRNECALPPNSVGPGAFLLALGSRSVSANDFTLTSHALPPGRFGVFFYGAEAQRTAFGDGFLCAGGSLVRLDPPLAVPASGSVARGVDFTQPPAGTGPGTILPGSTWRFQLWYRDPQAGGAGFSTSEALRVAFLP